MVMTRMTVLGFYYLAYENIKLIMQKSLNTIKKLKKLLTNWLLATKHLFTEKWNILNQSETHKRHILHLDAEVLEELLRTKDEFIVYLQDELAQLRASLKDEKPERIRVTSEFKQSRAYKSVHTRIREQVLANKAKHTPFPAEVEEENYEKIVVE